MMDSLARLLPLLALLLGIAAILLVGAPGPAYKYGMIALPTIFQGLKYGAYAGMAAGGIGILAVLLRIVTGQGAMALALAGILLGAAAFGFVYNFRTQAQAVPPIHDITTDTDNPPAFVAAIPLRTAANAINPPEYVGGAPEPGNPDRTIAEAQHAGYPDLGPLFLDTEPSFAFTAALATVEDMGWALTEADSADGRIEATDTTFWYGFVDDVVIRIAGQPDGTTRVDVRSKSRVGISDVGANAARIEAFLAALAERTGG